MNVAQWARIALTPWKGRMTVEAAPRRSRKPKTPPEPIAIGEINQTVFACPQCTRPLILGAKRCPGCGTRLIIGVQAQRAGLLLGVGLFAGLALGAVLSATAAAVGGAVGDTAAAIGATPAPTASASPSPSAADPSPTFANGSSSVPAISRSALAQTVAVDQRLTASKALLASALKAKDLDSYGVSQTLRAISADAVTGLQLSAHIGAWSGGKDLSGELTAFYTDIREAAASGLSASIRNDKAYRAAGQRMMTLLGGLVEIDALVRDVAGEAGVTFGAPASATP